LVGQLFNDDIALHFESIRSYADPELLGDEWVAARPTAEELRQ
jgi:hypothetical protein